MADKSVDDNSGNFDIIQALVETKNLTFVARDILKLLDLRTLDACREVSEFWNEFICQNFFESEWGASHRKHRFIRALYNADYGVQDLEPTSRTSPVYDIQFDKKENRVYVSANYGYLYCYDARKMSKVWQTRLGSTHCQISVGAQVIVAVSALPSIYVVDKQNANTLEEVVPRDPRNHRAFISGVRQYSTYVATCSPDKYLKFFNLDMNPNKDAMKGRKTSYLICFESIHCEESGGFTHLDIDEDLLVSATRSGEIALWNISIGSRIGEPMNAGFPIMSLAFQDPYVVVCSYARAETVRHRDALGVKIFDSDTNELIRHLPGGSGTHVSISDHFITACFDNKIRSYDEDKEVSIVVWKKDEVFDSKIGNDSLEKKEFVPEGLEPKNAMVRAQFTNDSLITLEGYVLKRRKFWPERISLAPGQEPKSDSEYETEVVDPNAYKPQEGDCEFIRLFYTLVDQDNPITYPY